MESRPGQFDRLRGATVLVTGGAGFIGSHLAEALLELGSEVRVLDDLSTGVRANVPAGAQFIEASVLDGAALSAAVRGCSVVFHQAAMVSVPRSVAEPAECLRQNVMGTERVLSAAVDAKVSRVVFAASGAAYGDRPVLPCREDAAPAPVSPYGMSKVAGEMLMSVFSRQYGLSTVSLRYMNVYGPRQRPDGPYAAAVSAFASALKAGRRPVVYGDGRQTRDWVHVSDVVSANLLAATSARRLAGEVVNIGTGRREDLLAVLAALGEAMGVRPEPQFGPERSGDVRDAVADIGRARELLGYEPRVDLRRGLAELADSAGAVRA